jgi:hypothetical protein
MPIDIALETLIPPLEVTRLRPVGRNGRPMHISTVYRHFFIGVRGVRLEYIRFGGNLYTSLEAVQRFTAALTPSSSPGSKEPHVVSDGQVERELNELGL